MAKQKTNTSSAPKFEWVPFEQLVFLENNPRTRTAEGLQKMAARIQADPDFYSLRPTLVNFTEGEYRVYAGDLRAHAAHDVCGWELVPCNVERNVPQDLVLSRALADNAHFEDWDGAKLSLWEFEPDELEELGVKWEAEDGEALIEDIAEPLDFSGKNKEVDVDAFESTMTIPLKYTSDEYWQVKEQLSRIAATPEQAVWKLLGNE